MLNNDRSTVIDKDLAQMRDNEIRVGYVLKS